ncbi:protein ZNRD2 isoform X2 [Patagioenas fasciata]|uniref:protein ZNRD2 isoform X2 n=1 Tax=Patagioenas fasciata TaxID=372321 RepID=UPI003A98D8CE
MALNAGAEAAAEAAAEAEAAARRERQERVSRALGELLLRGYRMLGRCCPRCGTILVQDKQQQLHCVTCQDPEGGDGPAPPADPPAPRPEHCEGAAAALRGAPPCPAPSPEEEAAALGAARGAVLAKLGWAARELGRSGSADGGARLCALIRACADALGALRALGPPAGTP